jgi:hypothetical protein
MQTHHGGCHCGLVRFRIQADLSVLTRCTCSICSKEGLLGTYVPQERFWLLQGKDDFRNPRANPGAYAVNVRCLDDFDLDTAKYEVKLFDGRNWEAAQEARLRENRQG